jgi:STE24 endopeptidase
VLCPFDRIRNTTEVCPAVAEVKQQIGGARVAVARLSDRARVDEPTSGRVEIELGRSGSEAAVQLCVVERKRERDVAVADEDERLVGREDRCGRNLCGHHVLPHGVAWTRVVEPDVAAARRRLERLEEVAVRVLEHGGRPARTRGRVGLKLGKVELPEGCEVVVPDEAEVGPLAHERATSVRLRPVAYEVPEAPDDFRGLAVDRLQHRFERMQVPVNVRDDADAHRRRRTLAKVLGILALAAAWGLAAALLWRTIVPDLDVPRLEPEPYFDRDDLERIDGFRAVTRSLWIASLVIEVAVLGALVWKARPLAGTVRRAARGRVRTGVTLGLVAVLAVWLARLPVGAFRHEWDRRYGLSRQSFLDWFGDQAISVGVRAALVSVAVAGAVALAVRLGSRWWTVGAPALVALAVVFVLAQPLLIQPLFNRFEPLTDRSLAREVTRVADRMGVNVDTVEVADASRRTTAANAYVAGIGPTRRVVLYDTILDGRFTTNEIVSVSAHELAHVDRRHLWKGLAWFALLVLPGLYVVARITERRGGLGDPTLVPLALLIALGFYLATLPLQNAASRRYEAEADWLALVMTKDVKAAISLDRRLVLTSLGDPDPPAWTKLFLATHPSAIDRIAMAEAFRTPPGPVTGRD